MMQKVVQKVSEATQGYYMPTPLFWRRIGDGLLGISTFITGMAISADYKEIAIGSLIIGSVGKFLTNFFKTGVITNTPEK